MVPRVTAYVVEALAAGVVLVCVLGAGDGQGGATPTGGLQEGDEKAGADGLGRWASNPKMGDMGGQAGCSAQGCHAALKAFPQVHPPIEEDQCDLCHEPKAGATPFAAGSRHEFKRAAGNPDLCYECHDRLDEEAHVHKPVGQGLCILCHDPHGSERAFLLRVEPARVLCMQCHRPDFMQGDHAHKPVAEGKCGECHEYHGGDHRRLLRDAFTAEPYEAFDLRHYALCYRCHESDQVTEATTTTATGFRNGDVNLHFVHVNREEKGRTCNVCHQMHASKGPHLVNETTPFGNWRLPLNYAATETGGSCLPGCHGWRGYDRADPVRNE